MYAGLAKNAEALKEFHPLVAVITDIKLDFAAFVAAFASLASVLENMIYRIRIMYMILLAIAYLHVWCAVPINCACLQPRTRAPSAPSLSRLSHVCSIAGTSQGNLPHWAGETVVVITLQPSSACVGTSSCPSARISCHASCARCVGRSLFDEIYLSIYLSIYLLSVDLSSICLSGGLHPAIPPPVLWTPGQKVPPRRSSS